MATIGHHCSVTGRWKVMGAADLDAFRVQKDGCKYEVRALVGTITVTCRCGYSEDVTFTARAEPAMAQNGQA